MEIVKNTHDGTLAFKDDDGKKHVLKSEEEIKCNYKKSMDSRLVIQAKKKKESE